jgi:transcriptional regulator with XRE-family HTH domain
MDEQTPGPGKRPAVRVDNRTEVRDFLTSRRGRITPEEAGLPLYGTNRRVTGLRREEVALLAGVSTDYYTRLERGNLSGVSESVLEALAAALKLDESERTHLFDLARGANTGSRQRRSAPKQHLREGVQRILDTIGAPAYVRNNRLDLLGSNRLGHALLVDLYGDSPADQRGNGQRPNLARYMFLDDRSRDFYVEWAAVAKDVVSALRIEAGRNPYDRGLSDLVGELSTRSDEFRTWWATHNVRLHRTSTKQMRHPVVGELELTGEALDLPADTGLTIITYTVEPASASEQALDFLASWTDKAAPSVERVPDGDESPNAAHTSTRSETRGPT